MDDGGESLQAPGLSSTRPIDSVPLNWDWTQTLTPTEKSWIKGVTVWRGFGAVLIRTMTLGKRGHGRCGHEISDTSSGRNGHLKQKYFYLLLCELKIYFDQTRGDESI